LDGVAHGFLAVVALAEEELVLVVGLHVICKLAEKIVRFVVMKKKEFFLVNGSILHLFIRLM
jgi:hypothetical protein